MRTLNILNQQLQGLQFECCSALCAYKYVGILLPNVERDFCWVHKAGRVQPHPKTMLWFKPKESIGIQGTMIAVSAAILEQRIHFRQQMRAKGRVVPLLALPPVEAWPQTVGSLPELVKSESCDLNLHSIIEPTIHIDCKNCNIRNCHGNFWHSHQSFCMCKSNFFLLHRTLRPMDAYGLWMSMVYVWSMWIYVTGDLSWSGCRLYVGLSENVGLIFPMIASHFS